MNETKLRQGAHKYDRDDAGCFGDGGLGHDHVRGCLATLLQHMFDTECIAATELRALLHDPMSDDAQEEYDAIELLNKHCVDGVFFELRDGDLMLSEEPDEDD